MDIIKNYIRCGCELSCSGYIMSVKDFPRKDSFPPWIPAVFMVAYGWSAMQAGSSGVKTP